MPPSKKTVGASGGCEEPIGGGGAGRLDGLHCSVGDACSR